MTNKWRHKQFLGLEFPDVYHLKLDEDHSIEIKSNFLKGAVKIKVSIPKGGSYESIISNGVVIDERDLNTNKSKYLEDILSNYHREISSLPDGRTLQLIGGNYGVLADFLGEVSEEKEPGGRVSDVNILLRWPRKIFRIIQSYLRPIFQKPGFWDIIDASVIALVGWAAYSQNFNYLSSGMLTAGTAVFSGYCDWLIRKKDPYLFKIITAFLVGGYFAYSGYLYQ